MGDDAGPLCRRVEYYGAEHPAEDRGLRIFSRRAHRRRDAEVLEEDEEEDEEEEEERVELREGEDIMGYLRRSLDGDGGGKINGVQVVSFPRDGLGIQNGDHDDDDGEMTMPVTLDTMART